MNPLVTKRAVVAAAVLTLLTVALAAGLFISVRNYDRPSDAELVDISATLQHFFRSYSAEWPEAHYDDESLAPVVTEAMQRDTQHQLSPTVVSDIVAEELASQCVHSLEEARADRGVIVTGTGHKILNERYLRTTVERLVVMRVETVEWRQEAEWDSALEGLGESRRVEEPAIYDVSLHRDPDGWRIVGMEAVD